MRSDYSGNLDALPTEHCQHGPGEDCMICSGCGRCDETCDEENELCDECRANENPRLEVVAPEAVDSEKLPSAESVFGPIIYAYTRAEAIDDGVLFDCGAVCWGVQRIVDILGFRYPVAMTAGAYGAIVGGCETGTAQSKIALAACLQALKDAIKRGSDGDTVYFTFEPLTPPGVFDLPFAHVVKLWSRCGPGDTAEPVITIMLEGED